MNKGRPPTKKNVYFRALLELTLPPPHSLQFGQLGPLFSDVKNNVLRVLQKKVPAMTTMVK